MTDRIMARVGPAFRRLVVDTLLAGLLGVALLLAQQAGGVRADPAETATTAVLVIGGLSLRRVAPIGATLIVALGIVATDGRLLPVDIVAMAVASYSLADSELSRWQSLAALSAVAGALGLWFLARGSSASTVGFSYLTTLPAWIAGAWTNDRRAAGQRRSEAERARHEERVQQAIVAERRRLARELHDVVAHDVGIMVVQAGGARQILTAAPERARQALLAIEDAGRDALAELRQILGLLADPAEAAPLTVGTPDLGRIARLVGRVRDAGFEVALGIEGDKCELPERVWAIAYRVVQEGITNAMKHGAGGPIRISVAFEPMALVVQVVDDGPTTSVPATAGRGLAGLRERAESCGGTLEAGPRDGGGFVLRAFLPLRSPSEP